ncbi:AAA family ATPase [Bacillus carboniphilus]|uniref:AAA family ATPase n=1 Tax=Bacillus carboniphilus TaxID=86663 RepID=A0ABY9JVH0_9BACI|nr:AAA family ATPase [Bacillus carboniphilus]WLR43404.1 AAA family ATPase [Bacillus carboniphilus]
MRTKTDTQDVDHIFRKISHSLNTSIHDQEDFINELVLAYKRAYLNQKKGVLQDTILLAGSEGNGKVYSLSLLIKELYQNRIIPYGKVIEIDLSSYNEREINTNFMADCSAAFEFGIGTVCFKGINYANNQIVKYITNLVSKGYFRTEAGVLIDAEDYFIVFCQDEDVLTKEEAMKKVPEQLKSYINTTIIIQPLSEESLAKVTRRLLSKMNKELQLKVDVSISFNDDVVQYLCAYALKEKTYSTALHRFIENDLFKALVGLRARKEIRSGNMVHLFIENDSIAIQANNIHLPVLKLATKESESLETLLEQLHQLIGLESVKSFVDELIDTAKIQKMRKDKGQKDVPLTLHMVFSGNPGTGKTTIARLISKLLKEIGILSKGQLVETARQDLVGEYVGSTAPKTNAKIHEAIGGVLFIDEAYTLARDKNDSFGREAIDTLVKGMEDYRDDLVVILAGYTNEMGGFLKVNPGLTSRFPFQVEFPDYTPQEMVQICTLIAGQRDYKIDEDIEPELVDLFEKKQIPGRNDSGNGRLVRNILDEAIRKQSARLVEQAEEDVDLNLLLKEDFGIVEERPFQLEQELNQIIGLDHVKTFIRTLEKQILVNKRRKDAGIEVKIEQNINMIFTGNPGTGKTTIARFVAQMLKELGVIKQGHLVEVGRTELVSGYAGQTAEKTKEVVESALGGVLFIDEAYSLVNKSCGGAGEEAINEIVRLVEIHKDNIVVILAGYSLEMEDFLKVNPGLASRFPLKIEFPDYSAGEMLQITELMVQSRGFTISKDILQPLKELFETKQIAGRKDIGNGRLVRNMLEEAIRNQAVRIADQLDISDEELTLLTKTDFNLKEEVKQTAFEELDRIIGLTNVKEFVKSLSAQIEMNNRRKLLGLPDMAGQSLHMVFKGNPGTGKTTVARILAKRLKELNVIKTDRLVETDRSSLVAGFVGQTAIKTKEVIESALGGVLFIDEAYSLSSDSFGKEAIDTLVKAMEDHKEELVVIVAGYDEDMEQFLSINPGLRSRFPHILTFNDYSPEELLQISCLIFKNKGYQTSESAEKTLLKLFEESTANGNGRYSRNICEKAIREHAMHYAKNIDATYEELTTIDAVHISNSKGESAHV